MNKYEFLYRLDKGLSSMTPNEREEITHYYDELIQDAVDSGKNEENFIERLGSIETILRTVKKDEDFVKNVKEKKNFELRKVFSVSAKVIGYGVFIFALFIIGSIAFSFVASGVSLAVVSGVRLVVGIKSAASSMTLLMYGGQLMIGTGLSLLGVAGFWWLIKKSKDPFEKLLEWIQTMIDRRGEEK